MTITCFPACKCNSKGTVAKRGLLFIHQRQNNACSNDSCTCLTGYDGADCNSCKSGYYITSTIDEENTCEQGNILGQFYFGMVYFKLRERSNIAPKMQSNNVFTLYSLLYIKEN